MNLSDVLEQLFDGDVDAPTVFSVYMQDTALHRVVRLLNMEYVNVLVENGAEVNAV